MAGQALGVIATGSYLPKAEVTNEEIAKRCAVTPEWIERKTEIRLRRYAAAHEATSDLAAKAAVRALDAAGLSPLQISYLIVATSTGDQPQPPTAGIVQDLIGARRAACFDIDVMCSGFVYGLELARSLLTLRPEGHVLVIAADVYSRILNYADHRSAVLLGDGAGAAVVGAVPPGYGIIGSELLTRGDAHRLIGIAAGGSRCPTTAETLAEGGHFFRMDGRGVRDFVMENVPPALSKLLADTGTSTVQIDHFVPHQPNGVLLRQLVERVGLSGARTHRTLEKYGNVGSASVPIALDDANLAGALKLGDLVLLAGFGGGMAVGTCLLRWWADS